MQSTVVHVDTQTFVPVQPRSALYAGWDLTSAPTKGSAVSTGEPPPPCAVKPQGTQVHARKPRTGRTEETTRHPKWQVRQGPLLYVVTTKRESADLQRTHHLGGCTSLQAPTPGSSPYRNN